MDLSIIILNYKSLGLTKQCLKGILRHKPPLSYEIIVIDNNSGEKIEKVLKENFPQVIFIQSKKNQGFSAGINLGIKKAQGKYILILNPDIIILDDSIFVLYQFMEKNKEVGLAAPKLLNPDKSIQYSCLRFPPRLIPFYRRTFLRHLPFVKKIIRNYLYLDFDHNSNKSVDWVLGGAMILRRETLERIGFLDERFFLYFDDVDLCRRIWQAGWQVYYVAEAYMVHYHQRESANKSLIKSLTSYSSWHHIFSWLKYFIKYRGKIRDV